MWKPVQHAAAWLILLVMIAACDGVVFTGSCTLDMDQAPSYTFVYTDSAGEVTSYAGRVGAARATEIQIVVSGIDLDPTRIDIDLTSNPALGTPYSYDPTASYEDLDALPMIYSAIAPNGLAFQRGSVTVLALSDTSISLSMAFSAYTTGGTVETLVIDAPNVPFQPCG